MGLLTFNLFNGTKLSQYRLVFVQFGQQKYETKLKSVENVESVVRNKIQIHHALNARGPYRCYIWTIQPCIIIESEKSSSKNTEVNDGLWSVPPTMWTHRGIV